MHHDDHVLRVQCSVARQMLQCIMTMMISEYNALLLCRQEPDGAKPRSVLPPESSSEEQEPVLTPQIPPSICYLSQHLLQPGKLSLSKLWQSSAPLGPTCQRTMLTNISSCSQTSLIGPPELFYVVLKNHLFEEVGASKLEHTSCILWTRLLPYPRTPIGRERYPVGSVAGMAEFQCSCITRME